MQTIAIPGTDPDNYYELRCDAFNVEGPSLTSVVETWNKLKPQVNQYADAQIKAIYHLKKRRPAQWEIVQQVEQEP